MRMKMVLGIWFGNISKGVCTKPEHPIVCLSLKSISKYEVFMPLSAKEFADPCPGESLPEMCQSSFGVQWASQLLEGDSHETA